MTRRLLALVAMFTLTACTDRQLAQWVDWFTLDPDAAVTFAQQPDIQAMLETRGQRTAPPAPTRWTVDWTRIAQCESGGNWNHPPVTNRTGTYSGGLMWNHRYWPAYGGDFARFPYQATMEQQIIASERLVDGSTARVDDAWDCY